VSPLKRLLNSPLNSSAPLLLPKELPYLFSSIWSIELFFKDSKQLLGLGHYQRCPYKVEVTHLHLINFAYALLTHIAISIVFEDTAQYLKELPDRKSVFKELSRLFVAS